MGRKATRAEVLQKSVVHDLDSSSADSAWGWLPTPRRSPGSLLVVDAGQVGTETQVALAILQGLVNYRLVEGGQAAYLQIPVMPNCFSEEVFNRWPELYAKQQGIVLESGTGQALVNLALGRGVDQFVIWDPNLPATINVATTLAWLRGTAAFSPDDAVGPLAENLHLALDLRTLGLQ